MNRIIKSFLEESEFMELSIVIPAYNEETRIVSTLTKTIEYCQEKNLIFEVIVVDDGSADSTSAVIEKLARKNSRILLLRNSVNEGKGSAVKKGMLKAQGDLIFFMDSDLSTPIEELQNFFSEIANADIVIASRSIAGANVAVPEPLARELLGKLFNRFIRLVLLPGFIDTQCGAKLFKRETAKKIFPLQKINRFAFDVEILYLARKFGCKIKELPVTWNHSSDTRVRTLVDGLRMVWDVLKIRRDHRDL